MTDGFRKMGRLKIGSEPFTGFDFIWAQKRFAIGVLASTQPHPMAIQLNLPIERGRWRHSAMIVRQGLDVAPENTHRVQRPRAQISTNMSCDHHLPVDDLKGDHNPQFVVRRTQFRPVS